MRAGKTAVISLPTGRQACLPEGRRFTTGACLHLYQEKSFLSKKKSVKIPIGKLFSRLSRLSIEMPYDIAHEENPREEEYCGDHTRPFDDSGRNHRIFREVKEIDRLRHDEEYERERKQFVRSIQLHLYPPYYPHREEEGERECHQGKCMSEDQKKFEVHLSTPFLVPKNPRRISCRSVICLQAWR